MILIVQCNNAIGRGREMVPLLIGLTVYIIISIFGPISQVLNWKWLRICIILIHHLQAGLNPARDLGPRLVAAMAGWGKLAPSYLHFKMHSIIFFLVLN